MAGKIVKVKTGELGRTYNSDPIVDGKFLVYIDGTGAKMACKPENLELIGYWD